MAGPYYLRSTDGSDASDGLSWANAKATMAGIIAVIAAGETCYVSDAHAESETTGALALNFPGTAASPNIFLCGDDAAEPPTALATTGQIQVSGSGYDLHIRSGYAYFYGLSFDGAGGFTGGELLIGSTDLDYHLIFDNCTFEKTWAGGSGDMDIGASYSNSDAQLIELINSNITLTESGDLVQIDGNVIMDNVTLTTANTTGFKVLNTGTLNWIIRNSDLSDATITTLFDTSSTLWQGIILVENCKIGSGVTIESGFANPSQKIILRNCDSGDTNYVSEIHTYQGSVVTETVKTRSNGSTDGVTPVSWDMTTTANSSFTNPLKSEWITGWLDSTGSKTFTAEILHDSVTALTDAEVWLEIETDSGTSSTQYVSASDRAQDILATGVDQPASTAVWTTTGLTNPNKQKLEVTTTIDGKGVWKARICLAKASTTIYACPKIDVTH
jgi:hypothetical protein